MFYLQQDIKALSTFDIMCDILEICRISLRIQRNVLLTTIHWGKKFSGFSPYFRQKNRLLK